MNNHTGISTGLISSAMPDFEEVFSWVNNDTDVFRLES